MTGYQEKIITLKDLALFRKNLAAFISQNDHLINLDSFQYNEDPYSKYDLILGANPVNELTILESQALEAFDLLKDWYNQNLFSLGFLTYDLKNQIEALSSKNRPLVDFPLLHFFVPGNLLLLKGNELTIRSLDNPEVFMEKIQNSFHCIDPTPGEFFNLQEHPSKDIYTETVNKIRNHILEGDVYELNYCRFFEADINKLNEYDLLSRLFSTAEAPFSAVVKWKGRLLFSASPERFLCKRGNKLISQPIKGTIQRGDTIEEDQVYKSTLFHSEKDRAENIMIVDLVRNDLSRSCMAGTVEVEKLFGIYGFKTVNHMVSTITGVLRGDNHPIDALKYSFPMGSMTGAPKIISMDLIEHYENFKRGLFSGSVGYIDADGDFDFNVVIRSFLVDNLNKKIFMPVGGAIVYDSEPELEYLESLLKASNLLKALGFIE